MTTPGTTSVTTTVTTTATSPLPHLEEAVEATDRYLGTLRSLRDDDVRAPSVLPGWSRGHVITHLARNADGLSNLLHWGTSGEERPMYPSQEARDLDIAAGAGRSAASLCADSEHAADRWECAARGLPLERLDAAVSRLPGSPPFSVGEVGLFRWVEVEVHHADLGVGYTAADWPGGLTEHLLGRRQRELEGAGRRVVLRLSDHDDVVVGDGGPVVSGTTADALWWLLGRGAGEGLSCSDGDLPDLGEWV